ncbi:MAG: YcxB family protein [Oscillospiraceae bacterium]|jgi:hypothetical protein|nr:YcxB family protein [Oscillospiraceae bacterium]
MDDVLFENRYELTPALIKRRRSLRYKRSGKQRLWLGHVFHAELVLFVVLYLAAAYTFRWESAYRLVAWAAAIFCVVLLLTPRARAKRNFTDMLAFARQDKLFASTTFGESVETKAGSISLKLAYDQIWFIDENDEAFMLWLQDLSMIYVQKNAFTVGDEAAFSDFIFKKAAEAEPLLTKQQLNRAVLKKSMRQIVVLAIITLLLLVCATLLLWA